MDRGKQVANSAAEKWRMKDSRDRVVKRVVDELINHIHVSPNLKLSLPELVERVEKFEEIVYASTKTEDEYLRVVAATSKSVLAWSWKDARAKNLLTSPSASGTDASIDWQENIYESLQFLKHRYDFLVHAFYKYVCKGLQTDTQVLNNLRLHKSEIENIFSLFELSKSQITVDMKDRPREIHIYIQDIIKAFKSPNVQSNQQIFSVPIGSSPRGINQPSIAKGPDDAVQQQTNNALEALRAAVGEIEELVHLNEKVVDELGLPTFFIPEGWKMPRIFVANALDTRSNFQLTEAAENQNLLAEIKDINNRLFDCEVVIAEKENVETAVGQAAEQSEGLLVQIMYNAVTINQNLVSKFTSDKKSLIQPLRLLIPASYPSSSLVILDELPLKVSDDLRGLFERAKAKLKYKLQSMNVPWLIKDIARTWENCAREAILEYADANGGGTFTSMHGDWDVC